MACKTGHCINKRSVWLHVEFERKYSADVQGIITWFVVTCGPRNDFRVYTCTLASTNRAMFVLLYTYISRIYYPELEKALLSGFPYPPVWRFESSLVICHSRLQGRVSYESYLNICY